MTSTANTLGRFIADLMEQHHYNNSSLAQVAGVSESAIRNLLKVGIEPKAKDPDPRTLRKVAEALGVDSSKLFRLAGYIASDKHQISVLAEYLGYLFDKLKPEKQEAILSLYKVFSEIPGADTDIEQLYKNELSSLEGMDLALPGILRMMANELIVKYEMIDPADITRIEPEFSFLGNKWENLPRSTKERVKALVRHKILLNYEPHMADEEWRK